MLIIAPPGERKSAVFSAMTSSINKFVNEYNALHLIDVQTYFNSKKMLDSKLNKAIEKGEDSSVIRDIQMEINALQPVKEIKLITTDVTAEALAAIMSDNNDTMGIMSPEGGIFDVISGMYSNSVTNLNTFLSSYDGEPVKIDRKYGSVTLTHPLLTFGICAQPQVLNNVISNQQFIGKGLTQRFLFCLPDSMIGHRKLIQDINGTEVTKRYKELIYRLLNMPPNPDQYIELSCKATDLCLPLTEIRSSFRCRRMKHLPITENFSASCRAKHFVLQDFFTFANIPLPNVYRAKQWRLLSKYQSITDSTILK